MTSHGNPSTVPQETTFAAIEKKTGFEVISAKHSKRRIWSRAWWRSKRVATALAIATTVVAAPPIVTIAVPHGSVHAISQAVLEAECGTAIGEACRRSGRSIQREKGSGDDPDA